MLKREISMMNKWVLIDKIKTVLQEHADYITVNDVTCNFVCAYNSCNLVCSCRNDKNKI